MSYTSNIKNALNHVIEKLKTHELTPKQQATTATTAPVTMEKGDVPKYEGVTLPLPNHKETKKKSECELMVEKQEAERQYKEEKRLKDIAQNKLEQKVSDEINAKEAKEAAMKKVTANLFAKNPQKPYERAMELTPDGGFLQRNTLNVIPTSTVYYISKQNYFITRWNGVTYIKDGKQAIENQDGLVTWLLLRRKKQQNEESYRWVATADPRRQVSELIPDTETDIGEVAYQSILKDKPSYKELENFYTIQMTPQKLKSSLGKRYDHQPSFDKDKTIPVW